MSVVFHARVNAFLSDNTQAAMGHLPGVRDGDAAAIHDARVATRRIRALLPLVAAVRESPGVEALQDTTRRLGRALGRARDLDVSIELLDELERRIPVIGAEAGALRGTLSEERRQTRRRLVKKIEGLELGPLDEAAVNGVWGRRGLLTGAPSAAFERALRRRLGEAGDSLRQAVDRAPAVYFADRAHDVRIAAKKLRYQVEIAEVLGLWPVMDTIKTLRRVQDLLGRVHDREVLLTRLAERSAHKDEDAESLRAPSILRDILVAQRDGLYARYIERRASLTGVADATAAFAVPRRHHGLRLAGSLAAVATAVAIPSGLWLLKPRPQRASLPAANVVQQDRPRMTRRIG